MKIMTARNGVELKERFESCQPGDIIQLKPHIRYHGNFILAKNNVTLLGAEGSQVVGTPVFIPLRVTENGCNLHDLTFTTKSLISSFFLKGNRCNITGTKIRGLCLVSGDDNSVEHTTIHGTLRYGSLQVRGKRNHFEGVQTQHGWVAITQLGCFCAI